MMKPTFKLRGFSLPLRLLPFLVLTGAFSGPLTGQESKWPPMTKELIERIENLPRERVVVHEEANRRVSDEGSSAAGDLHRIDHWKPLLIVLIGRSENLDREKAEKRYEDIMEVVGLLTQAELETMHGLLTAAGGTYVIQPAIATEQLLAHYARLVMLPDHWEIGEWSHWQEQWAGTFAENPSADPSLDEPASEDEERIALAGDWVATAESEMFGSATITPRRMVLIWQETPTSPVKRYSLSFQRIEEGKIYAGPNDTGPPYLLYRDENDREMLNIELRSEDPDLVKFELELEREEE